MIFLTFKDVKFDTWTEAFAAIRDIFAKETRRHKELLTSGQCDEYSKKTYETELIAAGVKTVYKYGVAFSGKKVEVTVG